MALWPSVGVTGMTEYSSGEYDYDIAIIGGGIHGAGIAQAGAAAG